MFIVTVDHAYYPFCEYFDNLEDAEKYMNEEFADLNSNEGERKLIITLAEVKVTKNGKADY